MLGLDSPRPDTLARRKKRGLWMAAKTASVSHARELAPDALERVLASGDVPPPFVPHRTHLLDEAPVPIVVMAEERGSRARICRRGKSGATWQGWLNPCPCIGGRCGHDVRGAAPAVFGSSCFRGRWR
ncbi:hypothetical protein [Pseudorhodoferax sp.]|uniref:hypothetical protein n=1 Tax=Pseudorhodoferax sp. TaxID=1993553 RepID=UPI0039E564D5